MPPTQRGREGPLRSPAGHVPSAWGRARSGVAAVDGMERIQFDFSLTWELAGSSAFAARQFKRQVKPVGA